MIRDDTRQGEVSMEQKARRRRPARFFLTRAPSGLWAVFRLLLLIGVAYVILYPVFVKLSLAFMPRENLTDVTVKWIPTFFTLDNIRVAAGAMNFCPSLAKTAGLCAMVSVLQVISCTMAGYGFARFKFKGNGILFGLVILTLVIPPQTYLITIYTQFQYFDVFGLIGLFNGGNGANLIGGPAPFLLLAATGMGIKNGLYIYILRQVFRGLPREIEEAARVDGAKMGTVFTRIMLPNVTATVVVVFLLSFVWQYNDSFFTGIFSPDLRLLSTELSSLQFTITSYLGGWNTVNDSYTSLLINTGSLLVMVPLVILFVFCQRSFVESVERSGLVG